MKTTIYILISLIIFFCFPQQGHSQNPRPPQKKEKLWEFKTPTLGTGQYAITVPKGGKRPEGTTPDKHAERFKIELPIEKDSAYFTMRGEIFSFSKPAPNKFPDRIIYWPDLRKGETVWFELTPDVSKGNKLTLFTLFLSGRMSFSHAWCEEGKHFKYKLFEKTKGKLPDTGVIMLIYADDPETNEVEKLVNNYCKNNEITNSPRKYNELLRQIEYYMLVHYRMDSQPNPPAEWNIK